MPDGTRHREQAARALGAGATARFVGRARLRLAAREDGLRVLAALEDALRTTDFADCGRLIVMRALRLTGLSAHAGAQEIARAIGAAWRSAAPYAVHFATPAAEHAPAVYFRSVHEARLEWLTRTAHGGRTDEWFWTRAVPEIPVTDTASEALPRVIAALAEYAPADLAARVYEWPVQAVQRMIGSLQPETAAQLTQVLASEAAAPGPVALPETSHADAGRRPAPLASSRRDDLARRIAELRLPVQDRGARLVYALWLRHVLCRAPTVAELEQPPAAGGGSGANATQAVAIVAAAGKPAAAHDIAWAREGPEGMPPGSESAPPQSADGAVPEPWRSLAAPPKPVPVSSLPVVRVDTAGAAAATPSLRRARQSLPWLGDNRPSGHGGLLMLVNALHALRFEQWLSLQSAAVSEAFGAALLQAIAARTAMRENDPQREIFTLTPSQAHALEAATVAWRGFELPAWLDFRVPVTRTGARTGLGIWLAALRRALRRHAGTGIASVVRRPAGVSITPTHADIVFALEDTDLRLRRAGLDADPGWVRWLGRIVAFYFLEGTKEQGNG